MIIKFDLHNYGFGTHLFIFIDWLYNINKLKDIKIYPDWTYKNKNVFFLLFNSKLEENNFHTDYFTTCFISQIKRENWPKNIPEKVLNQIQSINDILKEYNGYFWCKIKVYFDPEFNLLRTRYHDIINEYLIPKIFILNHVNTFVENYFGSKTIGIHIRTPKHYNINNIDINKYINDVIISVRKDLDNYNFDKIFIATDLLPFIEQMNIIYPNQVIYYEQKRITQNVDWSDKHLDIYDEWKYALIDALLLSKCIHLMGTSSNLFMFSLCINKDVSFNIIDYYKNLNGC